MFTSEILTRGRCCCMSRQGGGGVDDDDDALILSCNWFREAVKRGVSVHASHAWNDKNFRSYCNQASFGPHQEIFSSTSVTSERSGVWFFTEDRGVIFHFLCLLFWELTHTCFTNTRLLPWLLHSIYITEESTSGLFSSLWHKHWKNSFYYFSTITVERHSAPPQNQQSPPCVSFEQWHTSEKFQFNSTFCSRSDNGLDTLTVSYFLSIAELCSILVSGWIGTGSCCWGR